MLELVRANEEAALDMERKTADTTLEVGEMLEWGDEFIIGGLFVCLCLHDGSSYDEIGVRGPSVAFARPFRLLFLSRFNTHNTKQKKLRRAELKERMLERVQSELEELRAALEEAGACMHAGVVVCAPCTRRPNSDPLLGSIRT